MRSLVSGPLRTSRKTLRRFTAQNIYRQTFGKKKLPLIHPSFLQYKIHFYESALNLKGPSPSIYRSDTKPLKYWKLLNAINNNDFLIVKNITKKLTKRLIRKWLRKKLRRILMFNYTHGITSLLSTHKQVNKRKLKYLNPKLTKIQLKFYIKRTTAPLSVLKWKTSYPFLFTKNTQANKTCKPYLDLLLRHVLRPRLNRRVRRSRKVFAARVKQKHLRIKRHKQSTKHYIKHSTPSKVKLRRCKLSLARAKFIPKVSLPSKSIIRNGYRKFCIKRIRSRLRRRCHVTGFRWRVKKLRKLKKRYLTLNITRTFPRAISTTYYPTRVRIYKHNRNNYRYNVTRKIEKNYTTQKLRVIILRKQPKKTKIFNYYPTSEVKQPIMLTRSGQPFILKNIGLFLNMITIRNQRNPLTYKFLFKKKIFSFLYPNEVRNALMNRKKRIVLYKLVFNTKNKIKQKPRFSLSSFNKLSIKQYKLSLQNSSSRSVTNIIFSKPQDTYSYFNKYAFSTDEIIYTEKFKHRGTDLSFRTSEVKIPRVRFKPGYQRIWRRARTALKESLSLKFTYQQQLTKYLVRFYKGSNNYSFSRAEMSLNRILMYSRLLPDNPTVCAFLSKRLIYVNGNMVYDPGALLGVNDVLQIVVSTWYYVMSRWMSNWTLKRNRKFKKLVYRKGLANRQKVMKLKKQRSYYTPNWIYLTRYDLSDIKPYLEVDYFTLSSVILYEPFTSYYFSPDESPDFRPTIYRMYNWKYIT